MQESELAFYMVSLLAFFVIALIIRGVESKKEKFEDRDN